MPDEDEVALVAPAPEYPHDTTGRFVDHPSELVELARRVLPTTPSADRDDAKRKVARILGWGRYTQALDELLESALPDDLGVAATTP